MLHFLSAARAGNHSCNLGVSQILNFEELKKYDHLKKKAPFESDNGA